MKIATIVGARPQFVKAAVVSRAIAEHNAGGLSDKIEEIIIHTGQHYDSNMSEVFFQEMRIPQPNYNLSIGGLSQGQMTGRMLEKLESIFVAEKPDIILVYGDTNSTLAGALAAVKLHIPIAHVEAGLRSFNMEMPEEVNRILTDRISKWLFCPTETAINNLKREGYCSEPITSTAKHQPIVANVGDVMLDATLFYKKVATPSKIVADIISRYKDNFYISTIHRAENTDDVENLRHIVHALDDISAKTKVILPLHPRTAKLLKTYGLQFNNVCCIEPVSYFDMITLLTACKGVFTDSGGLQKEAYFFERPCITLRNETEWLELVNVGANTLVGTDYERIINAEKEIDRTKDCFVEKLYGNGNTAERILKYLK